MIGPNEEEQIQQAAFAKGIDAQAFCDRNYKTFEVGIFVFAGIYALVLY